MVSLYQSPSLNDNPYPLLIYNPAGEGKSLSWLPSSFQNNSLRISSSLHAKLATRIADAFHVPRSRDGRRQRDVSKRLTRWLLHSLISIGFPRVPRVSSREGIKSVISRGFKSCQRGGGRWCQRKRGWMNQEKVEHCRKVIPIVAKLSDKHIVSHVSVCHRFWDHVRQIG